MAPRTRKRGASPWSGAAPGRLAEAAARGDRTAQGLLFDRERSLLTRLAHELAGEGVAEQDLAQEGALGLLDAIAGFADAGGGDFDAYAEGCVRARMSTALERESSARAHSETVVADATAFERAEHLLTRELQRAPSVRELAAKLEWNEARVESVATIVDDARQRHDEDLAPYLDRDYFDPLDWLAEDEDGSGG